MCKVFISYSSRDRAEALQLMDLLEKHGCQVWMDFFDIQPTAQLAEQLSGGVDAAEVVCLLLSPTSVASQWVELEIDHALARAEAGTRILPVILRPCTIPPRLDRIVGIDAIDGLDSDPVRLRIVRAVRGQAAVDDTVLLDTAYRAQMEVRDVQARADRELPTVAAELDRVRDQPIRELQLSLADDTFAAHPGKLLEVRLHLDPLWNAPMSLWIAGYREGGTWPAALGFSEPPYTGFRGRPRIDAKFAWEGLVVDMSQHLQTGMADRPPTFSLTLDGKEHRPGAALALPKKKEIPALRRLRDDRCRFEVIVHDPGAGTAAEIDLERTDLDLVVKAVFPQQNPPACTLLRTRRTPFERAALGSAFLRGLDHPIEREAVLGGWPEAIERRNAPFRERAERIHALLDTDGEPRSDEERRLLGRLLSSRAGLAEFRGNHHDAFEDYRAAANHLFPVVASSPGREDGTELYDACAGLVRLLEEAGNHARAAEFVHGIETVSRLLAEADPDEPDFARLRADAHERIARVRAATGDTAAAARGVRAAVDGWRALAAALPLPARVADARASMARGLQYAARWGVEADLPVAEWRRELGLDEAAAAPGPDGGRLPVWLEPADPESWPTRPVESPLLRYALRMRDTWSAAPAVGGTPMEIEHVYRGLSPAEWLIVSCMDRADAGSDMKQWVEIISVTTGFPVLAMQQLDPKPQLMEWGYGGSPAALAARLQVDEAHLYEGMAVIPGEYNRMAHLYLVMARRGSFAWKVTLSFESACLPGMPEALVASNDHVRAGATFGSLRLL